MCMYTLLRLRTERGRRKVDLFHMCPDRLIDPGWKRAQENKNKTKISPNVTHVVVIPPSRLSIPIPYLSSQSISAEHGRRVVEFTYVRK